tara:strand:- start:336 stop:527 length:192 start_codon:yes stop_codon:yes gene_type:complete
MNIQKLINYLQSVEDKTLPIRIINDSEVDGENYWLNKIELSDTGNSGYEIEGELRLIGGVSCK